MTRRPGELVGLAGSVLLLVTDPAGAQSAPYRWTISASDTDPFVHSISPPGTNATFYLWLECSNPPGALPDGMASAEFDVVTTGNLLHVATVPVNGFFNAGTTSSLLLAVGGCEGGPIVAANLLVLDQGGGGTIGLDTSAGGNKGVVDCSPSPELWPMSWTGLGVGGPPPSKGTGCPPAVPGACCLPDGSCVETATLGECDALGGVYQGDGTICSEGCPVTTGACCFEDGGCIEVESAAQCEGLGGTFLGKGERCVDGCPSFAGACCLQGGSCVVAAGPQDCAGQGGVFQGEGTNCAGGCPAFRGACCFEDGSCVIAHPEECAALGGFFQGTGTDCSGGCESVAGACCFADGTCTTATGPSDCAAQGGVFQGKGSDCTGVCPVLTGACCFADKSCQVTLAGDCATQGGVFQGEDTDCTDCPVLTGACCFEDGSCEVTLAAECAALGGVFRGKDTDCTVVCPVLTGACCFEDGSCAVTLAAECASLGGVFQGQGTHCADCPSFAGACCFADGTCTIADGPVDCATQGGRFRGTGTDCAGCPVEGACCLGDGSCQQTDAATCAGLGGQFRGAGWDCRFCNLREPAVTWTISASAIDPFVNSQSGSGLQTRYLWFVCSHFPPGFQEGMAASAFDIEASGTVHLATNMQNGFLNAGTKSSLLLAVGSCPVGPVVAASLLVTDQPGVPGSLCLAPSSFGGVMTVIDCRQEPDAWSIQWIGYRNGGGDPCSAFTSCQTTALERKSWGQIKALYR